MNITKLEIGVNLCIFGMCECMLFCIPDIQLKIMTMVLFPAAYIILLGIIWDKL